MCLSKAWMENAQHDPPIMEEIAKIEVYGSKLVIKSLFGEQRELEANILEVDFTCNKILLNGE